MIHAPKYLHMLLAKQEALSIADMSNNEVIKFIQNNHWYLFPTERPGSHDRHETFVHARDKSYLLFSSSFHVWYAILLEISSICEIYGITAIISQSEIIGRIIHFINMWFEKKPLNMYDINKPVRALGKQLLNVGMHEEFEKINFDVGHLFD